MPLLANIYLICIVERVARFTPFRCHNYRVPRAPQKRLYATSFFPSCQRKFIVEIQGIAGGLRGSFWSTKNLEKLAQGSSQQVLIDPSDLETLSKQSITPSDHEASGLIEHSSAVMCHPNLVPDAVG